MDYNLSASAASIVQKSLERIVDREDLANVNQIVGKETGGVSLTFAGDAADRMARAQSALIEIASAYVTSIAVSKFSVEAK